MLHGFGGSARSFDLVIAALEKIVSAERCTPQALDLPGHGQLAHQPSPPTFEGCVEGVLARAPERFLLCGYSMGGRIALQVALAAPDRLSGLLLVSASAGIDSEAERRQRIASDERLAASLEARPFQEFVGAWRAQPLFADQPPAVRALAEEDMLRNDPEGLAAALRGLGAGRMPPLWGRLRSLAVPTVVLVGERDEKYVGLGRRITALAPEARLVVVEGGHGLLLENPSAVAGAISGLLQA